MDKVILYIEDVDLNVLASLLVNEIRVILYIEDVDLNTQQNQGKYQNLVILYIEDVDLNTLFSMSAPTLSVSSAAFGMWI